MDLSKYNEFEKGTLCFVHNEQESWRLCRINEVKGDAASSSATFVVATANEEGEDDPDGLVWEVPQADLSPLEKGSLAPVNDLLEMNYLHDSVLLHQIRRRYWDDVIYTNIGAIVLALNPYNFNLPLYTDNNMPRYIEERAGALHGGSKVLTHTWSVAHDAYWSMMKYDRCQSILVSGESGAGKTEAAKIVTKYLAACSTYDADEVESANARDITKKINQSSPILESFGNAKTLRNDNSSRFGKFMKLQFNERGWLHGCYTVNYLLEKSRVIMNSKGERSYHTYYHLVAGCSDEERERYRLGDSSKFAWMYQGIADNPEDREVDKEEYLAVREAFDAVGFTKEEQTSIYDMVAGIIHVQALNFEGRGDKSWLSEEGLEVLRWVCTDLWRVDPDMLYKELQTTTTKLRGEVITKPLTVAQAVDTRNALSKALYERTFQWIINRLNGILDRGSECSEQRWVGLLDIFGFENFAKNSFEQLCINFANEQLQNHYNTCVFSRDIAEYEEEGINTSSIVPPDNQPTLDLIGARMGILQLLNDQARSGTDAKFLDSVNDKHRRHKFFKKPRVPDGTFGVIHYAGDVFYTANGMREKNNDSLKDSLRLIVRSSDDPLIAVLLDAPEEDTGGARSSNFTVSKFFQNSLQELIKMIDQTNPHWIRCCKPHSAKKPRMFCGREVMEQLRCAGVLETVRIRQTGYSMRIPHLDFWQRFKLLLAKEGSKDKLPELPGEGDLDLILAASEYGPDDAQIGKTKVFLKDGAYKKMEGRRNEMLDHLALAVQRFAYTKFSYHARHCRLLKRSLLQMQRFARARYSHYVFRVKEYEWECKKLLASCAMQRNARAVLSGRIVFKKKVHHFAAVIQAALRAKASDKLMRENELTRWHRIQKAVDVVQRFTRIKLAEDVYKDKSEEAIANLEAEIDVMKEIEEERKQEELARKQARRDQVRAKKGLGAKAAVPPRAALPTEHLTVPGQPAVTDSPTESAEASPTASPRSPRSDVSAATDMQARPADPVALTQARLQVMAERDLEMRKQQRTIEKLRGDIHKLERELKTKDRDAEEWKRRFMNEEHKRKTLEGRIHSKDAENLKLQQQLLDKTRDEDQAEALRTKMMEDAVGDPDMMQALADDRRRAIDGIFKKLERSQDEVIQLSTNAIIRQPFGQELDEAARRVTEDIADTVMNFQQPREVYHTSDMLNLFQTVMKDLTGTSEAYRTLKDFCDFVQDLEKSVEGTYCLPRGAVIDALRGPLGMLQEFARLVGAKKSEDRELIHGDTLGGLESGSSFFGMGAPLERLKKSYGPQLRKIQERTYHLQQKILKMEVVQQDVVCLYSKLPELAVTNEVIGNIRKSFEDMSSDSAHQDDKLKAKLDSFETEQEEPIQHVQAKQKSKEEELVRLREELVEYRTKMQDTFFKLLQTEEAVAWIVRDYEYLARVKQKVEGEIRLFREETQGRVVGLGAGATLLHKEHLLVEDVASLLTRGLEALKKSTHNSIGVAHEKNYELMLKHFEVLEAFYNENMNLLVSQEQHMRQEEAKLYDRGQSGGGGGGLLDTFRSKESKLEKQKAIVGRAKDNLRQTHESLVGVREKFKLLLQYSNRMRAAEFLAKFNKEKYGQLLSTNTVPDAANEFAWPELEDLMERAPSPVPPTPEEVASGAAM